VPDLEEYWPERRSPAALKGAEMTAVLIAEIIVVGLVALIDLALTYALIRRVNAIQAPPYSFDHGLVPVVGHRIGDFASGRLLCRDSDINPDLKAETRLIVRLADMLFAEERPEDLLPHLHRHWGRQQ
jgi:hypothetical protein